MPEDGDSIKAVQSPRIRRQSSELSALRPKRQDKPQQVAEGSVEGILTLQLSHLNVVHTFRAVTVPVQVAPYRLPLFPCHSDDVLVFGDICCTAWWHHAFTLAVSEHHTVKVSRSASQYYQRQDSWLCAQYSSHSPDCALVSFGHDYKGHATEPMCSECAVTDIDGQHEC